MIVNRWQRIIGWNGVLGAFIVAFVVLVALAAPLIAPYDPDRKSVV